MASHLAFIWKYLFFKYNESLICGCLTKFVKLSEEGKAINYTNSEAHTVVTLHHACLALDYTFELGCYQLFNFQWRVYPTWENRNTSAQGRKEIEIWMLFISHEKWHLKVLYTNQKSSLQYNILNNEESSLHAGG